MKENALQIYQSFLDKTSAALLQHDVDTFLRHILMPHQLETDDELIEFDDKETARQHFEGFAGALNSQGIDSYIRIAKAAEFVNQHCIVGEHESFMTAGGKLVVQPFMNSMQLEFAAGRWGLRKSRHFTKYVSWPSILPRP
ncbi:MAG: hypothetical protein AAFN09_17500 [Pseudomonadota bacterium]